MGKGRHMGGNALNRQKEEKEKQVLWPTLGAEAHRVYWRRFQKCCI
ncbi:uncharacterized protein G2W53_020474 [Senna tora]|uniref:Uncharacterized protein n=1 Tax=Senna tora TaxID=362788 RepID=A0A834WMY1_9FABA|nr:uncharacterized protein G2W53_020474 [Senna tora]